MLFRANCIVAAILNVIAVGYLATSTVGHEWTLGRSALIGILFFSGGTSFAGVFYSPKSDASAAG